jgi:hypothetical protein
MRPLLIPVLAALATVLALGSPAPALAEPTLTVTPNSGPVGSQFVNVAEGLESRAGYAFEMRLPDGTVDYLNFEAGPDGRFTALWQVEPDGPTGTYTEHLLSADGGTVLATATFVVTADGGRAGAGGGGGPGRPDRP